MSFLLPFLGASPSAGAAGAADMRFLLGSCLEGHGGIIRSQRPPRWTDKRRERRAIFTSLAFPGLRPQCSGIEVEPAQAAGPWRADLAQAQGLGVVALTAALASTPRGVGAAIR